MAKKTTVHTHLSRRETQIMDTVYRLGEATVADVLRELPDPPGYNSVRVTLRILEEKGFLKHRQDQQRYVYRPSVPHEQAKRSAVAHLLETFFAGSAPRAVATLLDMSVARLDKRELDEMAEMIREEGKRRENIGSVTIP